MVSELERQLEVFGDLVQVGIRLFYGVRVSTTDGGSGKDGMGSSVGSLTASLLP
jgi:hypothetical protein